MNSKKTYLNKILFSLLILFSIISCEQKKNATEKGGWQKLSQEAGSIGKPQWQPMLSYLAELHQKSTHPPKWPFDYEWEEIGPGYIYGPAFGHWDTSNH